MPARFSYEQAPLQTECIRFLGCDDQGYHCALHGRLQNLRRHGEGLRGCRDCQDFKALEFPELQIAAAITTVSGNPARTELLEQTHQALTASQIANLGITVNYDSPNDPMGPFGNFLVLACYLAVRFPHASAYLISQDDTTVTEHARGAIETAWRESKNSFPVLSLWTDPSIKDAFVKSDPACGPIHDRATGWWRHRGGWTSPGACCYVFSDWGLRDLIQSPTVWWHRRLGPTGGFRGTDSVVGAWARRWGGIWHYGGTTLANHNGHVSTLERNPDAVTG